MVTVSILLFTKGWTKHNKIKGTITSFVYRDEYELEHGITPPFLCI